uniref:ABC transporter ATP-binding protein n=1 Tax=Agathobacter sp. TaxID=2021311 RepID=UPI004056A03C
MDVIQVENLKLYYKSEAGIKKTVDGISLEIQKGFTVITGPSGSGKSSLLQMIGGLKKPTEGRINVNGTEISGFNEENRAIFRRRHIGFIFRQYNLLPTLNVYENIVFPLELDSRVADREYIRQIAGLLGIGDKLVSYPKILSSGERQKVSIARALSTKPAVILADEPTGNLDSKTAQEVVGLLKMICREFNQTVILVTHEKEIAEIAEQVIYLRDGKVERVERRQKNYVR